MIPTEVSTTRTLLTTREEATEEATWTTRTHMVRPRPPLTHTAATLVIPTEVATRMAQETPTTRTVLTTREEVHMVRPRPAPTHTAATLVIPTEVAITTRMAQEIPSRTTRTVLLTLTNRMAPPGMTLTVLPEMTLTVLPTTTLVILTDRQTIPAL